MVTIWYHRHSPSFTSTHCQHHYGQQQVISFQMEEREKQQQKTGDWWESSWAVAAHQHREPEERAEAFVVHAAADHRSPCFSELACTWQSDRQRCYGNKSLSRATEFTSVLSEEIEFLNMLLSAAPWGWHSITPHTHIFTSTTMC